MKTHVITLSVLSLLLVAGCSDPNTSKPAPTSSAAETATVKTISLAEDLPPDIKGFPSEPAGRCAVDIVNDPVKEKVTAISRAAGLDIYGWALDENSASVPSVVFLHLLKGTENFYGQLNRRGDRDDLAKAFGKPEFINAGYGGTMDISSLPVGQYEILVIQKGENKSLVCSTNHKLELRD